MQLKVGRRTLDLSKPRVMGILNVTPDSFSDGGDFLDAPAAVRHAVEMVDAGAAIVDVGGESSRPGAVPVSEEEEIDRVVPVIEAIARDTDVVISVDTSKPGVMRAAVAAGANMINDVYALRVDGAMATAARLDAGICLMHMLGTPQTMQFQPTYRALPDDIVEFLGARISECENAGIARERLLIDPGFGFGKTDQHNLQILMQLGALAALRLPLLVGLSRP
jgi:dihydropteroate synthase